MNISIIQEHKRTIQDTNKPKRFRISSKRLFLTYSQIATNLTKENILEQLQIKLNIKEYIVALEEHNETLGRHAHVYLELRRKCDIKNNAWLDLEHEGLTYHGNYQAVRSKDAVIQYVIKEKNYIKSKGIHVFIDKEGKVISLEEYTLMVAREKGIIPALKDYIKQDEKNAVKNFNKVEKNIKSILRVESKDQQQE